MVSLKRLFRKKKSVSEEWISLDDVGADLVPEEEALSLSAEVMASLLGKNSVLEPEAAAAEAIELGWDGVRQEITTVLKSERTYIASAVAAVLAGCGDDCCEEIVVLLPSLPPKGRLVALTSFPQLGVNPLLDVMAKLEPEDMDAAFLLLAKDGSADALEALKAYLYHGDWRLVMRAGAALAEAGHRELLPDVSAARDNAEGILRAGLEEVIKELEAKP